MGKSGSDAFDGSTAQLVVGVLLLSAVPLVLLAGAAYSPALMSAIVGLSMVVRWDQHTASNQPALDDEWAPTETYGSVLAGPRSLRYARIAPELDPVIHRLGGMRRALRRDRLGRNRACLVFTFMPQTVRIGVGMQPILDPLFDAALGLRCSDQQRALLGPHLRAMAPTWRADFGFGEAGWSVFLEGPGVVVTPEVVEEIHAALTAFAARLAAPAAQALSAMALDLAHPLDAARAMAALMAWPGITHAVVRSASATPRGAAIAQVATTGHGLMDSALTWTDRLAITRGVLGVDGPPRSRLMSEVEHLRHPDTQAAMTLVDLFESCHRVGRRLHFSRRARQALAYIGRHGGAECMGWLSARAVRGASVGSALTQVRQRLPASKRGLLTLDASEPGHLSMPMGGELSEPEGPT